MARIWQEPKDPDEEFDYPCDWTKFLAQWNDTILTSTWFAPVGITVVITSNTSTTTTIVLAGGTAGTDYAIRNHIVTAGGRHGDLTNILKVRSK